ncbi:gliding motility-associated C-terminal domain-containing protein, partial [Belliella sp. R4-6]
TIEISGTLPAGASVAYENNGRTNVGNQQVTARITGSNFDDFVLTADLEITPATIRGITFEDGNFVFDGTEKTLEISGTLPNGASVAYANNTRTNVGTQNVTAIVTGTNYIGLTLMAELEVTPATLTLTVTPEQGKIYGETDPILSYTVSGFAGEDDESILSGQLVRVAGEDVGKYLIEQGSLSISPNYIINFVSADFEIVKKALTIQANDKSKIYGSANPVFTLTYSGLVNGDEKVSIEPSISSTATATSSVGTYPIILLGGSDMNYDIKLVSGKLEVTAASLTLVADDQSKVYDLEDPEFTYTVTGLIGKDQLSGSLSRVSGEDVGKYDITLGSLTGGDNYQITLISAQLEIIPTSIKEIFEIGTLDMNWGAVSDLPNSVALMATNGRPYFLDVTWNELPLNRFRRGTYDLVGEVIQTSWLKNPENLKAELQVRVLPKPLPQDILLSNNTFEGAKSNQEVAIGSLTVLDSIDNIHVLGVPYDLEDNRYFKVINDVLYWSSENPAGGRTTFKVVVRVTDRDLNTLDKVFTIERSRQSVASIEVFNTFTPNGDGMNDTWGVPDLRYYRNVRIQIFERGGERMFYTEDPDIRWDGTFNGRELPIGTYYWTIEVGETGEVRKGMLNLLRK